MDEHTSSETREMKANGHVPLGATESPVKANSDICEPAIQLPQPDSMRTIVRVVVRASLSTGPGDVDLLRIIPDIELRIFVTRHKHPVPSHLLVHV
jgi:hypothetical protein